MLTYLVVLITCLLLASNTKRVAANDENREEQNSAIRNVRAHYDAASDTITVDWEWRETETKQLEDYKLFLRYKISNQGDDQWRRVDSDEDGLGAKIPVGELANGDEITVQVIAEPRDPNDNLDGGGQQTVERSEPLVVWIARRADRTREGEQQPEQDDTEAAEANGIGSFAEEELIPPYNFTANILGPQQVQLQWRIPSMSSDYYKNIAASGTSPFYIVNVRQLSVNSDDRFPPQQIRVDGTEFTFGGLVPGENYEFTIRTALSPELISSAAAIVEIALPKEGELVEVGNLIVTSRFRPDGRGVVNLTWEVPERLNGKIRSYEMRYMDASRAQQLPLDMWEQVVFHGESPTAELYNLRAGSEYVLQIKTTLNSGVQVESGEFRFRTPKSGGVSALARLDVIYSSESPMVRLQWIMAPHISASLISGFDVFISDRYDLPEKQWNHHRVQDAQLALDSLQPSTTYFVRIDVRNKDGTIVKSPSIYRFTTIERLPLSSAPNKLAFAGSESLAFQQIGAGRVKISWTFPTAVRMSTKGVDIYYSSNFQEPMRRWQRVHLDNADISSVILVGLREGLLYHVQIVPVGWDGSALWEHAQKLQLTASHYGDEDQGGHQRQDERREEED